VITEVQWSLKLLSDFDLYTLKGAICQAMPIATATATRGLKAAPSKKKKTTDKPEETEVDLSQVSAYAVYNNLV